MARFLLHTFYMRTVVAKNFSTAGLQIIIMVIVTTLILCVFGAISFEIVKVQNNRRLNSSLSISTEQLQSALALAVWNIDEPQIVKVIESLMKNPEVYSIELSTLERTFLRTRGDNWEVISERLSKLENVRLLETSREIFFGDQVLGVMHVALTTKFSDESLEKYVIYYISLIILLDLFLILSLYLVHRHIVLIPLRAIEQYAKRVSAGIYSVDFGERRFPKEIDSLRNSIEKMVTQLETRYLETKKAKELAEAADRIKSEFLDIAAHELRTPLTPLTLQVQMVLKLLKEEKPVPARYFEQIWKQTVRLSELVSDLLNASRLERGGLDLHPACADFTSVILDCLDDFRRRAPHRTFNYVGTEAPIIFKFDSTRIYQVLANLLDNALKYTPEASAIEVTLATTNNTVNLSVNDHGPGIPLEKLTELFTKFFRVNTDATIRRPGLGLGLYICRRIIELHGGTISVKSEPGKGTAFCINLPERINSNE